MSFASAAPRERIRPRRPITVAHVTGETGFSGGEVQVFLLLEGLRKLHHNNVLVCPQDSASQVEAERRGIDVRAIPFRHEWSPPSYRSLCNALREIRPDIVHLHTGRADWLGGLATWKLGLPAITTRRMDRPIKRNLRTRIVYGACVERAIAISHSVGRQLVAAGVPEAMTRVVHSAVDSNALHPVRGRDATRAEFGVAPDTVCLLAVAALVPRKGIDVLLGALARLRDTGFKPVLWIAGEGPERGRLTRLAKRAQISDRVLFLGQRDDAADLLVASDIFVLPSRQEGLGVAALEAMALGRPVVASRVGGLAEVVDDGRSGLLVPPGDPEALGDAIARLLESAEFRTRLGAEGPRRVREDFSPDRMVSAYQKLYCDVIDEAAE